MSLLSTQAAHREYANRPRDERYPSIAALVEASLYDKNHSAERTYNLKDLHVVATEPGVTIGEQAAQTLQLQSPRGTGNFTHWSFGQLARTVGAPAAYLRELSPALAADCLNEGLQTSPAGTSANLLVRANGGEPVIRACTSDTYGRVWDADLYGSIVNMITRQDPQWGPAPTWNGEPSGMNRGDRDSFLLQTNGGSIVTDPSSRQDGRMYRGILIRNSEVGAASVTIETILFQYICGNHMLWGAMADNTFRRRHFGSHVLRDTVREIGRIACNWAQASPARDEAIIRGLIDHEVAHTREAIVDELKALGATKDQAESAYATCEQSFEASPRSFWGLAQGLTRNSQNEAYQNDRYELDRIAASLLSRGRKLVAA